MVRQEDIAKVLNISRATVSRALNGYEVSEKTKRRVQEAAKELGYVQNNAAVSLALKRSRVIHALLATSTVEGYDEAIQKGMDSILKMRAGYKFEIEYHIIGHDTLAVQCEKQLETFFELIKNEKVDGFIVYPLSQENLNIIDKECKLRNIPLMTLDMLFEGSQLCHVGPNYEKMGSISANLVAHLIQNKGTVLSLEYDDGYHMNQKRFSGFHEKMKDYPNIDIRGKELNTVTYESYESILEEEWSSTPFDAVYAPIYTNYVVEWLEKKGLTNQIVLVANDRNKSIEQYVKNGKISAILHPKPYFQGYTVAANFFRYFFDKEEFHAGIIDTGSDILIQENIG